MANTPTSEIFKDRRVQIGAAVAALLVVAGGAFVLLNPGGGEEAATDTASAPVPSDPGVPGAPGAPGAPAPPGNPGAPVPGAPGAPAARPGTAGGTALAAAPRDSWAGAPESFPTGGGDGTGAAPGAPGAPGAPAGTTAKLPVPIRLGAVAPSFRGDPFLSTQRFVVELPFAYQFIAPIRLASRPKPVVPTTADLTLEERLGPIPRIPRRVAGVLYDGAVSAILETGNPGPEADVRVIQPGSLVPSGVPGLQDFTVSVITTTKVTLRDEYGRTLDVALSTLPSQVGEALRQQAAQQAGQGGIPGGPGGPGGPAGDVPGGPGGFPGGAPPGAPGGFRGGRGGFRGADQ